MKKYGIAALALLLMVSCSRYHVKNEIKNGSALSKFKNSGIVYRIPQSSPISINRMASSLSQWLGSYQRINALPILDTKDKNIILSKNEFDLFLQMTEDDDFLYYKSLGILNKYLKDNAETLKKLITDNSLDSLIIYEVDPALSAEMQYNDFSSMLIIVNQDLNVEYMDRQYDDYETNEYDKELMQNHLLDEINSRFIDMMFKLKYLKNK
ncbi:MAG TPA: hypothetical protein PK307_13815 [Spirochaetota bacterium]|nr:hypothetical protein [Spirochaetota bacterium]HOD15084.1 hypothetical protein [Spirochaetota bacterium]HPG50332.1 hypothetical protein [Spirochaetota bacterium]HPN10561.1 hypothetical protein [Spirochaetota bacterium]HQL83277.1 hypothetical protein [Spirochaetota bacterium]